MSSTQSANLDALADTYRAWKSAKDEMDRWKKTVETLQQRLQAEMGAAEEATVFGRRVFTWRNSGQFNATRFTTEHPHLAEQFTVTRTVEELDLDALKTAQPDLFTAYRARRFVEAKS